MPKFVPIRLTDRFQPLANGLLSAVDRVSKRVADTDSRALRRPYAIRERQQLSAGYYASSGRQALARHSPNFKSIRRAFSKRQSMHGTRYWLQHASRLSSVRL